jgi:hypothetical protein
MGYVFKILYNKHITKVSFGVLIFGAQDLKFGFCILEESSIFGNF